MLWFALTVLAASAGLLVALPFLRTRSAHEAPVSPVDIYKAQLDEVGRDEAAGEVEPAAAAALRTEIERRILDEAGADAPAAAIAKFDRVSAAVVAAIVVLGSAVLYAATGGVRAPGVALENSLAATGAETQSLLDVESMIERLRARLQETPDDADGWRMLGWSYFETGDAAAAVAAYQRAVALSPQDASYRSAYAEALTFANNGTVSAMARNEFLAAIARDRRDERARYYLALAKAQSGDLRGAIDDWITALREAAPDSPWAARMRADIETAALQAGVSVAGRLPPVAAQAPPRAGDAASPSQAGVEAQADMIRAMVDGLEQRLTQNPRDAEGWVRLMRSRMVLGQPDRARAALSNALRVFRDDRTAQERLRAAAAELNIPS